MSNSPDTLRCVNLLTMGKKDAAQFSDKVARLEGIIPVYIHPYYADASQSFRGPILTTYQTRRDSEIATLLEDNSPIVLFEESPSTHPPLEQRVKIATEGTLYVVNGNPEPVDARWEDVGDVLREAQVKEIQLGGALSHACVRFAGDDLAAQGVKITFPLALFPPNPPVLTSKSQARISS